MIKLTGIGHYLIVLCGIIGVVAPKIVDFAPNNAALVVVVHAIVQVNAIVAMVAGGLSSSMVKTPAAAAAVLKTLCVVAMAWMGALILSACLVPKSIPAQTADVYAAEQCIQSNWGKPWGELLGTCAKGEEAVLEDAVADIEAVFEGGAVLASGDPGKVRAAFPYADHVSLAKLSSHRATLVLPPVAR